MDQQFSVKHLDVARVIERLHRRYLDLVRVELTRRGIQDASPAQVMMLFTIGNSEPSVRDLIEQGYYLGSNASYSLKGLIEAGYVDRSTSERDRRAARIRLTEKGHKLCDVIRSIDETYHAKATEDPEEARDLDTTFHTLRRLERIWADALRY